MLIFLQNCCFHSCDSRPFHHYEQRHQPKACWTKYFFTVTCMKLFTRASTSFPCVCSFEWNVGKVYKVVHGQGCALAEPCGPWHPAFALGQQENLFFFQTNHMLGNVDFTGLEHWAPFNFLRELPWWIFFRLGTWDAQYFISLGYSWRPSGSHHGQTHCSLLKPKSNPKQIPGPKFTAPKIPCEITKP